MNNIIIAGCSNSVDTTCLDKSHRDNAKNKTYNSYPHYINEKYGDDICVYNISRDAADNGTIARNVVQITNEVMDEGISSDDIYAIVQWSGIDRHSIFIDDNYTSGGKFFQPQYNGWSLSSLDVGTGGRQVALWKKYFSEEHTDESVLTNTLDNIKKVQDYFLEKNIKYKMICGWKIFEDDVELEKHIDISKFWFHSTDEIKYGGILDWVTDNVEEKLRTRGSVARAGIRGNDQKDKHPSNEAQKKFTDEVLINFIGKYFGKKEHIVTTGCSFTNFRTTWSDYLEEEFKYTPTTVLNVGHKGSSNDIILRGIVSSVDKLLRENKNIRKVIIQLTTMERRFMINNGNFEMSPPAQHFLKSSWSSWFMPVNEYGNFDNHFWEKYWKDIHSDELHFFELLEKIFMVQSYLKSKDVDYTMFCGWDLFTDSTDKDIFSTENQYENKNNKLLKDKFSHCKADTHNSKFGITEYWDMIDWDKWWFFENDKIQYGGLTEWSQYNLEKNKWYQDDLHPSFEAHEKFKDDIILKLIYGGKRD